MNVDLVLTIHSCCRNLTFKYSTYIMPIQSIKARQIYDSRGNPTVEVSPPFEFNTENRSFFFCFFFALAHL